jgi:transcriptional regulator with XRE-family HTH domain
MFNQPLSNMENLATRIRQMREHRKFTQEYVAEQLGISARTYRRLECKDSVAAQVLSLRRMQALAATLEAPLGAFLEDSDQAQADVSPLPDFQDYESLKKENAQLSERLHAAREERARLLGIVEQLTEKKV